MRKRIVCHLGPHKTGTTSFQYLLEQNEDVLNDADFDVVTVRSTFADAYKFWRQSYTRHLQAYILSEVPYSVALSRLRDSLVSLFQIGERDGLIVSDENLLGPMPGHFFANKRSRELRYYSAHELVFRALRDIKDDNNLDLVLFKRGLPEILSSSYKDFIHKLDAPLDFAEFAMPLLEHINEDYERFFWSYLTTCEGAVYSFAEFTEDPVKTASRCIGTSLVRNLGRARNPSLSWRACAIALRVIPLLRTESERRAFARFLRDNVRGQDPKLESQFRAVMAESLSTASKNAVDKQQPSCGYGLGIISCTS